MLFSTNIELFSKINMQFDFHLRRVKKNTQWGIVRKTNPLEVTELLLMRSCHEIGGWIEIINSCKKWNIGREYAKRF